MPKYYVRETFFRPREQDREPSSLPAALYNDLQLVLKRSGSQSLFVPIRSMQYQAVVERDEIVFVDSHGGYAHQDGVGGRLIRVAWQLARAVERASLDRPVPCKIVYYFPDLKEIQRRLMSEFPPVLSQILQRHRMEDMQVRAPRVVTLRPRA